MQFFIQYLSDKAGFDVNVFTVCDKVIEMSDSFAVNIQ